MQQIEFRRIRNFNQTINAATEYLRQNFDILSKTTMLLVLPLLLLGLVIFNIGVYFLSDQFGNTGFDIQNSSNTDTQVAMVAGSMIGMFFFLALGMIVNIAVLYEHMRLYSISTAPEQIKLRDLLGSLKRKAALYIKTTIGLYFVLTTLYMVFVFITAMLALLLGMVGGLFFLFIGFILGALLGIYFIVAISMLYIVRTVEGASFINSLQRCFQLVRDGFGTTLAIFFITYLLISSVIALPTWFGMGIISAISLLDLPIHGLWLTMLTTLGEVIYVSVYLIINSLGMLVIAFRYFSLVEQREAVGILRKIAQIGGGIKHEY